MGLQATVRWAVFLCVLITNQYFINASFSHHDHVIWSRHIKSFRDKRSSYDDTNESKDDAEIKPHRNSTSGIARHSKAQKRFFFTLLFIVSIITTVVATVVETIHDIGGCCSLGWSSLCSFESRFTSRQSAVNERAKKVDEGIETAVTTKNTMETLGETLEGTWKHIDRIITLQKKILKTIDPNVIDAIRVKIRQIKRAARKSTEGIDGLTMNDFDTALEPVQRNLKLFSSWTFGPGMLTIEAVSSFAFKRIKVGRIYKALKATQAQKLLSAAPKAQRLLGFSDDAVKGFLKATALAKFSAYGGKAVKFLKVLKGAGAVLSVIGIGVDLYSIINTLVECDKKSNQAADAIKEVEKAEREVSKSETELRDFNTELKTFMREKVMPTVREEGLHQALEGVRDIIDGMDKSVRRPWDYKGCVTRLSDTVIPTLKTSDDINALKESLEDANENCLKQLEYTMECWLKKTRMVKYVLDDCKDGRKPRTLILREAMTFHNANSDDCINNRGEPYTTKAELVRILQNAAETEKFSTYCKANSLSVQTTVCDMKTSKSAAEIVKELKKTGVELNAQVVEDLLAKCSSETNLQLNPRQRSEVCDLKRAETFTDEDIEDLTGVSVDLIKAVECPEM